MDGLQGRTESTHLLSPIFTDTPEPLNEGLGLGVERTDVLLPPHRVSF